MSDAAAGDHFRREAWQAQLWQNESPQDRKCQQMPCVPAHQGKKLGNIFFTQIT